jgi:hypothetical protein
MAASIFNLRVPLPDDNVFLMNTLTDAQIIVSADVAELLDSPLEGSTLSGEARDAFELLVDQGFVTPGRDADRGP